MPSAIRLFSKALDVAPNEKSRAVISGEQGNRPFQFVDLEIFCLQNHVLKNTIVGVLYQAEK